MNQTIKLLRELSRPEKPFETIAVTIKRYYTDVDGRIVNKNVIPANFQISFPIYLGGEFDRQGGYKLANVFLPPSLGSTFVGTFSYGNVLALHFFNPLSEINNKLLLGDVVNIYTDNVAAPSYFCYIVITGVNNLSWSSILANSLAQEEKLKIKTLQYFTDNENQWGEVIKMAKITPLGRYTVDSIGPIIDRTPETPERQGQFINLELSYEFSQYILLAFYMLFDTDVIKISFKLN